MAYPTYSPENRLLEFLRDENTTPFFVGTLASLRGLRGLSQSRLSAVVRGRGLEHDAAKALGELMAQLEKLRDAARPFPIRFHNAADINDLLKLLDDECMHVVLQHLEIVRHLIAANNETIPAAK